MRNLTRIILIFLAITLILLIWLGSNFYRYIYAPLISDSWVFKENQTGSVIGDLGGIPVSIPHPIARFVEYEGDPHFLEPRKGPVPVRTYQSKLRSFGFEVRFPDMAFLNNDAAREEKRQSNIYNSMWLGVGIHVAPYNNQLGLKKQVDAIPSPSKIWVHEGRPGLPARTWKEEHGYLRAPKPLYGLVVYEVQGYDKAKRQKIPGNGYGDRNIYYHRNKQGNIDAYIKCSNIKHDAAPCGHSFVLANTNNTMIEVSYRIGLLPSWHEIQESVNKVILGFAVDPNKQAQPINPHPLTTTGAE